jgi:catechol 2,3-dioxygenase-like lactoylglutathione lyase family enzyme
VITGINHINISVQDIERSFLFYKNVLGFKPLCKSDGSAYFLAGNPDTIGCLWFSLDLGRNHLRKSSPCNTHFAFSVDEQDYNALSQRIIQSGARTTF